MTRCSSIRRAGEREKEGGASICIDAPPLLVRDPLIGTVRIVRNRPGGPRVFDQSPSTIDTSTRRLLDLLPSGASGPKVAKLMFSESKPCESR